MPVPDQARNDETLDRYCSANCDPICLPGTAWVLRAALSGSEPMNTRGDIIPHRNDKPIRKDRTINIGQQSLRADRTGLSDNLPAKKHPMPASQGLGESLGSPESNQSIKRVNAGRSAAAICFRLEIPDPVYAWISRFPKKGFT